MNGTSRCDYARFADLPSWAARELGVHVKPWHTDLTCVWNEKGGFGYGASITIDYGERSCRRRAYLESRHWAARPIAVHGARDAVRDDYELHATTPAGTCFQVEHGYFASDGDAARRVDASIAEYVVSKLP